MRSKQRWRYGCSTSTQARFSFRRVSCSFNTAHCGSGSQAEPFADQACRPFFSGLLPEGELRQRIAQHYQISRSNDFGLFAIQAHDADRQTQTQRWLHPGAGGRLLGVQPGGAGAACGWRAGWRSGRSGRRISELRQFGDYEGEESPVEDRGFELDKCSRSKRASLDSIAASRAFSLLSCSVSFSICFIL